MRLVQRNISMMDVQEAICNGEIIENYPDDYPYPSCLVFGYQSDNRILHVVCACNDTDDELWLITAYFPTEDKWENDFKTRRESDDLYSV